MGPTTFSTLSVSHQPSEISAVTSAAQSRKTSQQESDWAVFVWVQLEFPSADLLTHQSSVPNYSAGSRGWRSCQLLPGPLFQIRFVYMILSNAASEKSTNETFSPRWTGVNRGFWWFPLRPVASMWSTWTLTLGQPTDSETTFSELELFGAIMVTLHSDFQVSHSGQPQITSTAMAISNFLWFLWFFFSILEHSSFMSKGECISFCTCIVSLVPTYIIFLSDFLWRPLKMVRILAAHEFIYCRSSHCKQIFEMSPFTSHEDKNCEHRRLKCYHPLSAQKKQTSQTTNQIAG